MFYRPSLLECIVCGVASRVPLVREVWPISTLSSHWYENCAPDGLERESWKSGHTFGKHSLFLVLYYSCPFADNTYQTSAAGHPEVQYTLFLPPLLWHVMGQRDPPSCSIQIFSVFLRQCGRRRRNCSRRRHGPQAVARRRDGGEPQAPSQ
jgi:hypothetical protein